MRAVGVRQFHASDAGRAWADKNLPNVGSTAAPSLPLDLPLPTLPPSNFPDLGDIEVSSIRASGDFLVVAVDGPSGMGGIRPYGRAPRSVLRVRVQPAMRRLVRFAAADLLEPGLLPAGRGAGPAWWCP